MKTQSIFSILLLVNSLVFSAEDKSLEKLWNSLSNITNPTIEDYKRIEYYMTTDPRPYLDPLRESLLSAPEVYKKGYLSRFHLIQNFKFLGPQDEPPLFEIHHFNLRENTKKRCILIFASHNPPYPEKARALLSEIKYSGYSGDVLLRIGGFPNTAHDGLKICHIPYSFKVAFLQEAYHLGYEEILWLDTAMHPLRNMEKIFSIMDSQGHFFLFVGTLEDNFDNHLPEAAKALKITTSLYPEIPHLCTGIMGFNLKHSKMKLLLDEWYKKTEEIVPSITWFPEELSISVLAWNLDCPPIGWFGEYVCAETELDPLPQRVNLQFYLDPRRPKKPQSP